jgi:CheY-like chemotaxis protein
MNMGGRVLEAPPTPPTALMATFEWTLSSAGESSHVLPFPSAGQDAVRTELGDLSILVIEDNSGDVILIREALEEHGLRGPLSILGDGEKAINMIDRVQADSHAPCPDLVILDLNLPKVSGHEILKHLRSSNRWNDVPVVILSSSNAPQDRQSTLELGATGYIRKPSSFDEFLAIGGTLRSIIERHR